MEKKQEITEEQVKEYQMLLAQWMQLPKDALEILNEDMPWRIREWLYVCALDQISGRITSNETTRAEKRSRISGRSFSNRSFRIGRKSKPR